MGLAFGDGSVRVGFPGRLKAGFWLFGSSWLIFLLGAILKDLDLEDFFEAEDYEVEYNVQEVIEV